MATRAYAAGLEAFALTDHDTLAGLAEAGRQAVTLGIRLVPGCEFSVRAPWGELHVLAYFLAAGDADLETFLADTRAARRRRGEQIVARLQHLGLDIDFTAVAGMAGAGAVGRPHVARALVRRGLSSSVGEAFEQWLGRGRPAFVEKPLPALARVAELVHRAGGVTVAAHLGERGTEGQVRAFRDQGLDGIEVRHPSHTPAAERRLTGVARRLGMAVTGGSDWHGDGAVGDIHAPLGSVTVPLAWVDELEKRRTKASNATV